MLYLVYLSPLRFAVRQINIQLLSLCVFITDESLEIAHSSRDLK
jgi:hypothetical protein